MDEIRKAAFGLPQKKGAENRAFSIMNKLFGNSFVELEAYRASRDADGKVVLSNTVTGYGAVNEALAYAFAQDVDNCDGAISTVSAEKIVSLIDRAGRENAPLIGFFDSRGAQINEGLSALSGYGKIMCALAKRRGKAPLIAVIAGSCTGGLAVIAKMFDTVIALKDSKLYVNPPYIARDALAEQGIVAPELGTVEAAAMRGEVSLICSDIDAAIGAVSDLLGYLVYPFGETEDSYERTTEKVADIISKPNYDAHGVIAEICDEGKYFECKRGYASELLTVFGRICGDTVAIVASNPGHHGGHLSERASGKAAEFIKYANRNMIPVVTLVDTLGFDTTAPTEVECTASRMADLARQYAENPNTHVTVITGRAYGTASVILGSRAIGADICLALEGADISILDPETAVQFMYGGEIDAAENPAAERAARMAEWKRVHAGTAEAAMFGDIDDIISASELRARIAAAIKESR